MRIEYLQNLVDRETFAKVIQKRDALECRNRARRDALNTLIVAGSDILRVYNQTLIDLGNQFCALSAMIESRKFTSARDELLRFVNELLTDAWNVYGETRYAVNLFQPDTLIRLN